MSNQYFEYETHVVEALHDLDNNVFPSVAAAARRYGLNERSLQKRAKGRKSRSERVTTTTRLTQAQEKALCAKIDYMDSINMQIRAPHIRGAAEHILAIEQESGTPLEPLGPLWVRRFLRRNPQYKKRRKQSLASARKDAYDFELIRKHFDDFRRMKHEFGIADEDTWNMDESGFRVGCGVSHAVITRHVNKKLFLQDAENRDFVTSVECINAAGRVIPPALVLKGSQILHKFGSTSLPGGVMVRMSESGSSSDQFMLEWIKHFDKWTSKGRVGTWRLLIFDGGESHFSKPFFDYATAAKIKLFVLPPHSTHWAQPLDIGCFQPMKHYHAEAIDHAVRMGDDDFNRLSFLDAFSWVRPQAFKPNTVRSAFMKTGLVPWNPNVVLDKLRGDLNRRAVTPPPVEKSDFFLRTTPTKPKSILEFGQLLTRLYGKESSWMSPDLRQIFERYNRGVADAIYRLGLLQRDIRNVHKSSKRKSELSNLGQSIASKSGVMTVSQIRESLAKRQDDDVEKASKALARALRSREIRAEQRTQAVKGWLRTNNKPLYNRMNGFKSFWVMLIAQLQVVEQIEGVE